MSKTVKVTYNADTLETTIVVDGKEFDTSRIIGKEIADWAYPFMIRRVRWDGFYDEMVQALGGQKAFDLVFEGSEEALAELKEAWDDAPINVVSGEQGNIIIIMYDADALTTEITVNGQTFDTTRINGKEIEDWVYPFMMRKVKWDGIFDKLKSVLGTDEYDIQFSGTRDAMKVLMEECPETVSIYSNIYLKKCEETNKVEQKEEEPDVRPQTIKTVYMLSECNTAMEKEIGKKAVNRAVLFENNLPTPSGFVITADVCPAFLENGYTISNDVISEIDKCIQVMERETGKKTGDSHNPLILAVSVSPLFPCPGLMDVALNIGFNDEIVNYYSSNPITERWAWDCYRRLIAHYGTNVNEKIRRNAFSDETDSFLKQYHVSEAELSVQALKELVSRYKSLYKEETGEYFPQDTKEQLMEIIKAAYRSWDGARANVYRRDNNLPFYAGMGIVVQEMIYGNKNDRSGTGVLFSRDPATGEKQIVGEFLTRAQGEDVVAGKRQPMSLSQFQRQFPVIYNQLETVCTKLES